MYNDSKICFLIPIHPPHYNYLTFLNKLTSKNEFTIVFILTFINDKISLIKYLNNKNIINSTFQNIKFITLEENDTIKNQIHSFNDVKFGIINIKKFYGLYYLINNNDYDKFDYIAVIDSEIEFINIDNLYNKFKLYCDRKTVIAGNTTIRNSVHYFLDDIHNKSIEHIKINDRPIINNETKNGKYYFWYSDINIYDRKLLPDFFKYINFDLSSLTFTNFIRTVSFWSFDYVIYYYYCIAHHNYKIVCMEDYGIERQWSLEAAPYDIYIQIKEKMSYTPNIVIGNCYYKNKDNFLMNDDEPIFIYHLNNGRYFNLYNKIIDYLDN
jgi:hypothetical protein